METPLKSLKIQSQKFRKIINSQLDIKLRQFTEEELNIVLTEIKSRKAADLDEIPPEVWKTRKFEDILLRLCNTVNKQNPFKKWSKGCILSFLKKGDLQIIKNYRGIITLIDITVKV